MNCTQKDEFSFWQMLFAIDPLGGISEIPEPEVHIYVGIPSLLNIKINYSTNLKPQFLSHLINFAIQLFHNTKVPLITIIHSNTESYYLNSKMHINHDTLSPRQVLPKKIVIVRRFLLHSFVRLFMIREI